MLVATCGPALAGAIVPLLTSFMFYRFLRSVGRWRDMNRWRRARDGDPLRQRWLGLSPVQKGWFYGVPFWLVVGSVCILWGLVVDCPTPSSDNQGPRANSIMKSASSFFAAELDRPHR